jgi:hypothetical protein
MLCCKDCELRARWNPALAAAGLVFMVNDILVSSLMWFVSGQHPCHPVRRLELGAAVPRVVQMGLVSLYLIEVA